MPDKIVNITVERVCAGCMVTYAVGRFRPTPIFMKE